MPNADLILQVISLTGAIALVGKLFFTGLWKRYPVFFWYFVFRIPNTTWPLLLNTKDNLYEHVWLLTEPLAWLFHILVVAELFRLVLENLKGIQTLGRWAMYVALAIAIPLSILSIIPKFNVHTPDLTRRMGLEFATARGVDFSLALFLLLILLFLSRYPVDLSRNVVVHSALYTIMFFSEAFGIFLRTFRIGTSETVNLLLLGLSCVCILAWIILLTPRGEKVHAQFPTISPQRERSALRQLESINATLLKVSGK